MKVLLVHGVGHADLDSAHYYDDWQSEIANGLKGAGLRDEPEFVGFHYDDLFEKYYSGPGIYATALAEMLGTAAWHWISDPITNLFRPSRGFPNPYGDSNLRWMAGMVAQLAVEDTLRKELRARLRATLLPGSAAKPFDLIAAHSLGSLITYDFFRHDPAADRALKNGVYLTFGAQINNDFARSRIFPGRLTMPPVRSWYHLFNDHDPVLTAPIRLSDPAFRQVDTSSASGHSPTATSAGPGYLDHPQTLEIVWPAVAQWAEATPAVRRSFGARVALPKAMVSKPERRALLIGINEYPDPANRLNGCVNDVFLMSSLLQERGFEPENIRVVLNERATADAIRERLAWLLYRADDKMERALYFSGHGAQMPGYNAFEEVDHVNECLVPYDFDWTEERAITDKDFYRLYSDLPFGARFFAMFDCCHSGGLTKQGSRKARAIDPPDDIRHRMLRWNAGEQMWTERKLPPLNPDFGGRDKDRSAYMGSNGATYKLGRAMRLRTLPRGEYDRASKGGKAAAGPYLPVLIEACGEGQFSYEYNHGATPHGAFTYAFVKNLRKRPRITFKELLAATNRTLKSLRFDQDAQLVGPKSLLARPVPGNPRKFQ